MAHQICIVGSRTLCNPDVSGEERAQKEIDWLYFTLDKHLGFDETGAGLDYTVILSGGAKGVDRHAEEYARKNGIPFVVFKPYHLVDSSMAYSPRFFFTRNKQLVDNATSVIAIWDGASNGTRDVIRLANKKGKPITVFTPSESDLEMF